MACQLGWIYSGQSRQICCSNMLLSGIKSTTAAANISQLVGIYENIVVVVITNVGIIVGFHL